MNKASKPPDLKKTIKVSELKAKCLALVGDVARTGQSVVITKRGEPVATLAPYRQHEGDAFGILKDQLIITGDIMSPIDVEWDAMK